MVFQDFDLMQERRRQDRARRLKRRLTMCAVSTLIIVILIVGGAFVFMSMKKGEKETKEEPQQEKSSTPNKKHSDSDSDHKKHSDSDPDKKKDSDSDSEKSKKSPSSDSPPAEEEEGPAIKEKSQSKLVIAACNTTLYKDACEKSMQNATKDNPNPQPKDVIKSAISVASEGLDKAFANASKLSFNSPEEKQGLTVCQQVMGDAKADLQASMDRLDKKDAKNLSDADVLNWMSAVMSYQEACVDAFPEGKLRSDVKLALNSSQELTSNSLAMIEQLASFSSLAEAAAKAVAGATGAARHLLGSDGLPEWMGSEGRRFLKGGGDDKPKGPKPNVTVAKDGSGDFKIISEALAKIPEKYDGRYVIFVKAGIYEETVNVTKKMVNVTMYGDGSQKSVITGKKNAVDGVPTYLTATFVVSGEGFMGKAMGFRNTAGPEKHQAVAARVQADKAVFLNCRFEGFQDTLYVQAHRQFYRSCVITGTIDFIFGDAAAVFQNCEIQVRKPLDNQDNVITAQGRKDKFETTAIVLQNCEIMPHAELAPVKAKFKTYLGQPWKEYSRTVVMESTIEDLVDPAGWKEWNGTFAVDTLFYGEFKNDGPGAKTDKRVKWSGRKDLNKDEAIKFSAGELLQGDWIAPSGATVRMGLGGGN